ncbi:MAG: hypothetical protein WC788_09790 [Candidatus Paceibacterota bacterium]
MKNNVKESLKPIHSEGRIGQIVVLDKVGVSADDQLHQFEQPHLFRIISKEGEGWDTVYKLESLASGKKITLGKYDSSYFYDASEWAYDMRDEKERQKKKVSEKIEDLKGKIAMLTDILTKQGNRVIVVSDEEEIKFMKKIGIIN